MRHSLSHTTWLIAGVLLVPLFSAVLQADEAEDPFAPSEFDGEFGEAEGNASAHLGRRELTNRCHCIDDGAATQHILSVLRSPLRSGGLEFAETALEEVVHFLQEEYEIPVMIDRQALDDVGIGLDEPITIRVREVTLQSALRLMLRQLNLAFTIRHEVLWITTWEEEEHKLRICVYDVRDLVEVGEGDTDLDSLMEVILSCVATDTWAEKGGGNAELTALHPGLLVISQTSAVHTELNSLLATIRRVINEGSKD